MPSFADTPTLTAVDPNHTNPLEAYVRRNPGGTLLVAVGLGIAAVLIARALTPAPTPRSRALRLLEDIQERLAELAQPSYERVAGLAEDGAHAVGRGMENLNSLHLDRKLQKVRQGIMGLFH